MKLILIISSLIFFSVSSFAGDLNNDPAMKDFIGNRTMVQAGAGTVGGECPDGTCFDALDSSPMVGTKGILGSLFGKIPGIKGSAPAEGTDGL